MVVAVELRKVIAAKKSAIKFGQWKNGKVPKADFPLAKEAYALGNAYQWCVITFAALEAEFRVLVMMNPAKEKYDAILGIMSPKGLRILCTYQYHAGEPGWHCHATCDDASTIPVGVFRGPWVKRIPHSRKPHRRMEFGVDSAVKAVRLAQEYYGIEVMGSLL